MKRDGLPYQAAGTPPHPHSRSAMRTTSLASSALATSEPHQAFSGARQIEGLLVVSLQVTWDSVSSYNSSHSSFTSNTFGLTWR